MKRFGARPLPPADNDGRRSAARVDGPLTALWHGCAGIRKSRVARFPPWRCKVRSPSLPTARRRMSSRRCARRALSRSSKRPGPMRRARSPRSSRKRWFWPSLAPIAAHAAALAKLLAERAQSRRRPLHAGHRPHPRRRRSGRSRRAHDRGQRAARTAGAPPLDGAARAHSARHGAAPHPHARLARRGVARTAGGRSARRSQRAGRRTRPLLSGFVGRGRRARRRGRRAVRRERGARAQCARHRRHGDRRRFWPEDRRSLADRARRGRALSRSAGRRARRSSRP